MKKVSRVFAVALVTGAAAFMTMENASAWWGGGGPWYGGGPWWGGYPYYGYGYPYYGGWGGYPYYGGWGGYPYWGGWGVPYTYAAPVVVQPTAPASSEK